jgi:uncharacterized protein YjbI with pentapeptide repeats
MRAPLALSDPPPPAGGGNPAAGEAVVAKGPARFTGWSLAAADLRDLDLHGCEFVKCRAALANFSSSDFT